MPTDGDKPHLAISKRDGKGAGPAMTARKPHPLRCETCEYHDCASMMKHPHHCDHPMYRDMDNPDMLSFVTNEEYGRIKWMGCASHSAASRPHPAPAPEHRTYETCHKRFSCPDGEECWYWSADYYWDCGKGAARLFEENQKAARKAREDVLDIMDDWLLHYENNSMYKWEVKEFVKSLRQQDKGG